LNLLMCKFVRPREGVWCAAFDLRPCSKSATDETTSNLDRSIIVKLETENQPRRGNSPVLLGWCLGPSWANERPFL